MTASVAMCVRVPPPPAREVVGGRHEGDVWVLPSPSPSFLDELAYRSGPCSAGFHTRAGV